MVNELTNTKKVTTGSMDLIQLVVEGPGTAMSFCSLRSFSRQRVGHSVNAERDDILLQFEEAPGPVGISY